MDTTIDRKKKKSGIEHASVRPSEGKPTKNVGEDNLKEFDWDASENKHIIKEWDERSRKFSRKYDLKGSTPVDQIVSLTEELKKKNKSLSHQAAWDQAWQIIMKKKL